MVQEYRGFYRVVSLPAGERGGGGAEINRLVDSKVGGRIDIVIFQNIFEDHFRHTACPPAEYRAAFEHRPFKVIHGTAADKEVAGALRKLRKVDSIVLGASKVCVDGSFR